MKRGFNLMDTIQFGPHILKVTAIYGLGMHDPESMITATCVDSCCSNPQKIVVSMPAKELLMLAEEYTEKVGTMKMKAEIAKIMADSRKEVAENPRTILEIPLDVQCESPFSYRAKRLAGIDY